MSSGSQVQGPRSRLRTMDYSVLQQCMHCGMCLPVCPTYVETGRERNSPRGRIALMRGIADGDLNLSKAFADEMYYCLGCLACVTACPAGVDYPNLFEAARADIEDAGVLKGQRTFWRWLAVKTIFMHPRLLRFVGRGLWLYQRAGLDRLSRRLRLTRLLPKRLRELEPTTPRVRRKFSNQLIDEWERPEEAPRFTVGMLTGCVQDLAFSHVNRDTVDALLANGCAVFTPPVQYCCGSLHAHNGELDLARDLARRQLDAFDLSSLDAIITNAGGCGSHLRNYGHLLEGDPRYADRAREWDRKCRDIHEWLVEIDFRPPASAPGSPVAVTYHDSCHLCHGQKVARQPREILRRIPGVELRELPEASWCCGSAGIYNITQPAQAGKLQHRKMENIARTGCPTVATANPGCHLQLENGFKLTGRDGRVLHPVSLLAEAYRKEPSELC
ncbi:MAG: (Fe-S)-binding protein [Puniceicoccaceae bacterium]